MPHVCSCVLHLQRETPSRRVRRCLCLTGLRPHLRVVYRRYQISSMVVRDSAPYAVAFEQNEP